MKRLMIMAAGTGGHIFPGIAIAQTMRARGWEVSWLGTSLGMEQDIVPRHGIPLDAIDFSGMRGKGLQHTLAGAFKLTVSFASCLRIISRRKPDVVLGMGGYVTVPGGLMARLRGIPLALVNADAALLLSNKTLTPLAQRVLFGFPADFGRAAGKASVTGNPVRKEILDVAPPQGRFDGRDGPLRILVVGGSLGAKALNDSVPAALALMPQATRAIVTHQSGKKNIDALRKSYLDAGVEANVVDFIEDMGAAYAAADLVICRAGAITMSELTAAGVASVLVPFVAATTSHQRDNAQWMATQKAAIHLPQQELNAARVVQLLESLTRDDCRQMAIAAQAVGKRDANDAIADILEKLADSK
ncbi:undecaprenyldiphospho-muramoylpentapeptide beta-N-acetylglucosaminyltransferase [Massilia eurypsychrophila]|jgi:UDP-N-acetylglucosamine--N-acetylmuramyl-(pentapeptide) pyrophosphoryl-undecaprenol N-acetylglucosamine transferase|uniref:UDP-N-acetylglucosamine--N-acetylmuramyl-(pentapeptide) pyrophosphoryl-undecaprenol N-acetylglucosamine transferase n=1 Tax=Massilia eurypsychrophila TaxID=1485217 RepID=A0A2G8TH24_9BURK|nr:undecaprenyldiphospho-muramoylpentapeptide beta-N-acetylglucosaminyltransferase [Massilia eurypsychrophila]PIL45336.1 undecaprenyldiphospho-muramoylpentapeptide beta-N-acetylglucosaminyltransferase [Massilia eurypsychrophila]